MSLKFTDGFDHYATAAETAANITSYLQAAGYVVNNATNTTFNLAAGQDSNSLGLKMSIVAGAATPPSFSRSITTAATLVVFGFSFRGTGARIRFARIAGVLDLDWDPTTGKMKVGTTLGADVIILNAFWFIEIEIDRTANEARIWANDTLQLTVPITGVTNTHTITWGLSTSSSNAATIEIDDLYIVDNDGGTNVTRLGPVQVVTRAPTTDVPPMEWTPVGSTTSHASILGQLSPGAANAPYLQANVDGKKDRFTSNNVLPNANQIFATALTAYSRKGDLDNRNLGLLVETAGGSTETQIALDTAYKFNQVVFEQAPGGVAWDQNRVESSTIGIIAR